MKKTVFAIAALVLIGCGTDPTGQSAVQVSADGNGSVNPSGNVSVEYGDTLYVTAVPDTGYHFISWIITGGIAVIDSTAAGEFRITGDGTIAAQFAVNTYTVTVSSAGNGTVFPSGNRTVTYGDTLYDTAVAAANHHFVSWAVTGGVVIVDGSTGGRFRITGNGTVTASFAINTCTLTLNAGTGGTINPSGSQRVNNGDTLYASAIAAANHHFFSWAVTGGVVVVDSSAAGRFWVTGNGTVTANFAVNTCTLTLNAGTGGTVNPSGTQIVNYGAATPITAIPNTGYSFVRWTRSGTGAVITDSTLASTTVTLTATATVTAEFAIRQYTLTVSATNGTVAKSPDQSAYDSNTVVILTATPDTAYHFTGWSGNLVSTGNPDSVRMDASKSITANFAINTYTVSVASTGNGSVSPSGNRTVNHGDTLNITALPDVGYHFFRWIVTGGVAIVDSSAAGRFRITGNGNVIAAQFKINVPADSLLVYYPFDSIGVPDTLYDLGPRQLNQYVDGAAWAAGRNRGALNFDGVNDSIRTYDYDTSAVPVSLANNFSYSFWVYPRGTEDITAETASGVGGTTANKQWAICATHASCKYDAGCNLDNHAAAGVSVGTNGISVYEGSGYYLASILVYAASITGWTHLAIVYNNNQPSLYVNGTLVRTGLQSTHIVHPNISFGGVWWGGWYNGMLDEVRVYKRSLTDQEVLVLYQEFD